MKRKGPVKQKAQAYGGQTPTISGTANGGSKEFVLGCLLCFLVLGIFNIMHHVMWRDELEAWMMARDASTLSGLFSNIKYQGHPALWFLSLYALSAITPNPAVMQFFHLAIAAAVAYVALRFAPFTKLQKVLFVFGYYPFYEYCVISRNYSMGLLSLLIFLAMFRPNAYRNYIALSAVLFIMCQSNPYAAILAIALFMLVLFEFIFFRDKSSPLPSKTKWQFAAGILIFIFGLLISAMQMHPPGDSVWYHPTFFYNDKVLMLVKFLEAAAFIWRAYVPIPRFNMHFWGHNFISYLVSDPIVEVKLSLVLSIVLAAISFMLFLKSRIALFYYSVATFGITLFCYAIYGGSIRHWGHYYIVFATAVWLSYQYEGKPFKAGILKKISSFSERNKSAVFTTILVLNVVAGVTANTLNYLYPFSANKETAAFIKENGLDKMPILGDKDYAASGVAAYLNRPIYYPVTDRVATFVTWDIRRQSVNPSNVLEYAERYSQDEKQDVLLVLTYPPSKESLAKYNNCQFIKEFANSSLYEERFLLLVMKYVPH
ncbi:MAG: hypothetical protein L7F77_06420 [Candidatus Magnetominusculus sp. LBB02]|nr:hypothetical protein [Candidatus Magnetominusculus sp. LBB02]